MPFIIEDDLITDPEQTQESAKQQYKKDRPVFDP